MDGWMSRDDGMRICMEEGERNGNNTLWRMGEGLRETRKE